MMLVEEEKDNSKKEEVKRKLDRNKLAYLIISFNQGLSSVSELAVSYYFKDHLKIEPARLSQIMSFVAIPWMIKPVFGLITDLIPVCGYRRKIYIILCGLVNVICWTLMTVISTNLFEASGLLLLINAGLSFSTVLGEAIVVELSQDSADDREKNTAKDYVSLFFMCKYSGALVSAYLKGYLVERISIKAVFFISSLLPWLLVLSGFVLVESTSSSRNTSYPQTYGTVTQQETNALTIDNLESQRNATQPDLVKEFFKFVCKKFVLIPTIFIIVFMATPSYSDPFFYFLTDELKFTPIDLGKLSFFSTLATLIAIIMYKQYFKNCNFKLMITIGTILSFIFSFCGYLLVLRINLKLGISDFFLVLVSNSFLSMLGELILMPMLTLACLLCPKNLEGTVYSLFMSALNFGSIISGLNGSFLTSFLGITSKDYSNLYLLILIANILSLVPLPLLCCINGSYFNPELEETKPVEQDPSETRTLKESDKPGRQNEDINK